jgi:RimJ/RimL family protein N-acetyltransferase
MSEAPSIKVGSLVLRPPRVSEAPDALLMLSDEEVVRWNGAPSVVDLKAAKDWCRRGGDWSSGLHHTFSVVDSTTQRLVANISIFQVDHDNGTASVGYRTAPWARRRGVASAALNAVTVWAFDATELFRLELRHAVPNHASCKVAHRADFKLEATLRLAAATPDGARHDEHLHARLRTDSPAADTTAPSLYPASCCLDRELRSTS